MNQGGNQSNRNRRDHAAGRASQGRAFKVQLQFEALEARRLLAGLNVSVFLDQNANQAYEPEVDEVGAGRILYLDQDRSGDFTTGEPIAIAGLDGLADFGDLDTGDYWVGLMPHPAQKQVTSTGVAGSATLIESQSGKFLLPTANQDRVWLVDSTGRFGEIGAASFSGVFDGEPVVAEQFGPNSWLVVLAHDSGDYSFVNFDASTGASETLTMDGLPYGVVISDVAVSSDAIAIRYTQNNGTTALAFADKGSSLTFGQPVPTQDVAVAANYARSEIYSSNAADQQVKRWDWLTSSVASVTQLDRPVGPLELSSDGVLAALASDAAGHTTALVLAVDDGFGKDSSSASGLAVQAILADAAGPLVFSPGGKKLLSSSTTGDMLAWDRATWQLLGRTSVGQGASLEQVHVDRHSEYALLLGGGGVYSAELAVARPQFVQLRDDDLEVISLGVRLSGANDAPTGSLPDRVLNEDTLDKGRLQQNELSDGDGDSLYFSVLTPPASGKLTLSPDGNWEYTPGQDFAGADVAEVLVHDGVASSVVTVQIDVLPVNDPPMSLTANVQAVQEGAVDGEIGLISIVDVDRDASYVVTTNDERITVREGRVYASGSFDHETEQQVVFDIYAVDASDPNIMITTPATLTIADVNEPPTAIRFDNVEVEENVAGGVVGRVILDDPDTDQRYETTVSDSRFEIVDEVLKLRDGETLDFESEPTVEVVVTAVDQSDPSLQIASTVTIEVQDANDSPKEIVLSRSELASAIAGAEVGTLSVDDDDLEVYTFAVSDPRFEVDGNLLRLKEDQVIDSHDEPDVTLSITATSRSGETIQKSIALEVVDYPPYHNPDNPEDVNGDGEVTPLDVLLLINRINAGGGGELPHPSHGNGEPPIETFPDVNGDNQLTPVDVLMIVNYLNSQRGEGEGSTHSSLVAGSSPIGPYPPAFSNDFQVEDEEDYQRRIQAELEEVIESLSRGSRS